MSRARAIVVTPRLPWPLDDGGRHTMWQSVWWCSQAWETTLVSLVPPGEEHEPLPATFAAMGVEVVRLPHRIPAQWKAVLRGTLGRWPYMLTRYRDRGLESTLRRLVAERAPEFVLLNHLHMATALDALAGTATVLRQHNLEHNWLARYAASLRQPLARAYARHQVGRMRAVEARLCDRCDLVLAMQDLERDEMRRLSPHTRVETVTAGLDLGRFLPWAPDPAPTVLLNGSFAWPPNRDGARRFLVEGWARLRALVPDVRLRLVGKDLPPDLAETARAAGAEPVGYVQEMAPEFARAHLMLVPLWVGAGARVKIVEALGAGLPVVSTALGAEGLHLQPGRDFLEAETPVALAEAAAVLLRDPGRASAVSEAGRAIARDRFTLDAMGRLAQGFIAEVVEARRRRSAAAR